ncbi:hypothetical protein ElyMa_001840900 [Elysia marginata]|uniref:Uncharacterized protein n=1 Tax=Elysia marginata TaxID=1093978 RepID=A0AAV4ELA1_9GAST|nr:hypothetical protein ElyMa_001840900 [Elysia marginata]
MYLSLLTKNAMRTIPEFQKVPSSKSRAPRIVDNLRDSGQPQGYWTTPGILDNARDSGQPQGLWTTSGIVDNPRNIGQPQGYWTTPGIVDILVEPQG